ncbi:MAG: PorV/PorQ family protein [Clostridia bacterium]|nr:PorV/PorQ family protein [Clostridia bacterium]
MKRLSNLFLAVALAAMLAVAHAPAALASTPPADPVDTGAILDFGMGARALAMGGAFVAVADDGTAVYYNPAGLAFVKGHNVTSMYSTAYGAGNYLSAGYAQKNIGVGLLGLMATVGRTDEFGNPTTDFSYLDGAVLGGYAYSFGSMSVGGALKLYGQSLPDNPGFGVTGDVGVMVNLPNAAGLKLGAVGRNLLGTVKYKSGFTDNFDRKIVVGASVNPISKLIVAADFDITAMAGHFGAEYQIHPMVALRAGGVVGKSGESGMTAGVGFAINGFHVDYAYQMHATLPDAHRVAVGFSF